MTQTLTEKSENITLSAKDYQTVLEAYQKLGQFLAAQEKKKAKSGLKTLYGMWQGVEVNEKDFEAAGHSLFKTSL